MELPCLIERVRFRSPEGFTILSASLNAYSSKYDTGLEDLIAEKIRDNKYDTFTITITASDPEEKFEGRQCVFIGDFSHHPKYGDQFKAEFYYQDEPTSEDGLQAYLMTLPNIKEVRSKDIIKRFGIEGTIDVLDNHPYRLVEINGITEKRVEPIKQQWDKDKTLRDLYVWLSEHGISLKLGQKAFELWSYDTQKILCNNPYRLTEIHGIGFIQADQIAHQILDEIPVHNRVKSCINYILKEDLNKNSNLCSPFKQVQKETIALLCKCDEQLGKKGFLKEYADSINPVIKNNLDVFAPVRERQDGSQTYLYLRAIWNKEKAIAKYLYDRSQYDHSKAEWAEQHIEMAEEDIQRLTGINITLDDKQKEAVQSAFENKITVITGGGGTGKSTICRCIYYLAIEQGLSVRLMSPTGKAAQVLANKTQGPAATIHRSLKMMPGEDFAREDIKEDIIIVDEVSMVGVDTMFAILNAMEENPWGNIVFVGDSNQLPSVSPGNFLSDIIDSGCANVIRLDRIHRQSDKSYISYMANEIAKGKVMDVPEDADDVKWHNVNPNNFSDIIQRVLENYMQHHEIEDLQILAPMKKGLCGVYQINEVVQKMMAEKNGNQEKVLKKGFRILHVGDRVIQTKNNYDKMIFNGDMGVIINLGRKVIDPSVSDQKEDFVEVDFYGDHITFLGIEIEQLQLAWCVTVHKFQGSQAPYIIFVLPYEARIMMNKELIYTGFTRAEKFLALYGSIDMLRMAPQKSAIRKRYTNMNKIIEEIRSNRNILQVLE